MNFDQLKEIINMIDKSSISTFTLKFEEAEISLSKNLNKNEQETKPLHIEQASQAPQVEKEKELSVPMTIMPKDPVVEVVGNMITSPLVGTFYESASPVKPPFVSVGQKVKKGDVLCIIEAMKIMNEITSKYDGEIAEILIQNGEMAEYGQNLFRVV